MTQTLPPQPSAHFQRQMRLVQAIERAKFERDLVTPEGAIIRLNISKASERIGAFAIDISIQWFVVIASLLILSYVTSFFSHDASEVVFSFWLVGFFFFRNFYYIFFEVGRRAATPGKRLMGLRVASRDGGRLTANAVLARNFIREIEIGLPFQFLMMGGGGVGTAIMVSGLIWSGIFLFFPLFNKDRMRVGDLIAGTWVVHAPKAELMGDISSSNTTIAKDAQFAFTPAQVDAYGIHELHVLEDVLRQSTPDVNARVAERIRAKIGWIPQPGEHDKVFLEAYYAALRRRLEQRILLGERKSDKFD
ncbi:MAG: RDD family protein [Hyphomonas sp.]